MIRAILLLALFVALTGAWQSCIKDKQAGEPTEPPQIKEAFQVKAYFLDDSSGSAIPGLSLKIVEQVGLSNGRTINLKTDPFGRALFNVESDRDLLVSIDPEESSPNYLMRNFKLVIGDYPYSHEETGAQSILPGPAIFRNIGNTPGEMTYTVRVPGKSVIHFDIRQEASFTRKFRNSSFFFEGTLYLFDSVSGFNLQRMEILRIELPIGQTMKDQLIETPVYAGKSYRFDWSVYEYQPARSYYEDDSLNVLRRDFFFISSPAGPQARQVAILF